MMVRSIRLKVEHPIIHLSIPGLATTAALNAVENKIPEVSDLAKKADYDEKVSGTEKKIFCYFWL